MSDTTRQALAAQREQFEAWCIQRWRGDRNALLRNLPDAEDHPDEYKMGPIEFAWQAYRAALSAQPVAGAVAQPTPNFSIIWTICRFALHSPTEVLMHQIERLANELHGEEQQKLRALLIRARNPQAQKPATKLVPSAAPAPEPSAQPVAGAVATEPSEEIQELRAQVEAWRKQCETLTNQVICCGVAARHPDATLTTRGAYAGKWNSPQAEEVRKLRAERDALLAAAPQPAPSAQAVAHPSHQTVREWMPVSEALRLSDLWTAGDLDNCGQWRAAIKVLADEVRALAASPQPAEPSAQGEPVRQADERGDMAMREWHRECDDADTILRALGLDPVNCRTDGGSLKTGMILDALQARDRILQRAAPSTQPHAVVEAVPSLHPATADLVRRFSQALAEKLAAAEAKYGYSDGWASPDWMDECRAKLMEHIAKGDPRDVAAYCAFLWHHGASTAHAVVEAVPLNFDQLQKVMSKHFGGRELTDDEADSAEAFARAIERAHGIAPKAAQEKT